MILLIVAVLIILATALQQSNNTVGSSSENQHSTLALDTRTTHCPPWNVLDRATNSCQCYGSNLFVVCNSGGLKIQECYCMTNKGDQPLVGSCIYTCHRGSPYYFVNISANTMTGVNQMMCGIFNRDGEMCGKCIRGHAPPVYSYSFRCVKCTTSNWIKYLSVSLLPSTVFFIIILLFRVSATSPSLSGFILCNQIMTSAFTMRALVIDLENKSKFSPWERIVTEFFVSMSGIWNLDFLRIVYRPFCLQSNTNNLQLLAVDYITGLYPLFLVVLVYGMVVIHERNVGLLFKLGKPVISCFIRFRRQWNIRHSLVETFATFLLLSYVKILSVSCDILLPTLFFGYSRYPKPIVAPFIQGNISYFGSNHLPYACLALFFLVTFTLLPMLLMFLFPCNCFQVFLNHTTSPGVQTFLRLFMDSFQGHYKDGSDGQTRDLRYFSGIYLLIRVLFYTSIALAYHIQSIGYTTVFLVGFTAIVAYVKPFKKQLYNFNDVFFLSITTMLFICLLSFDFSRPFITEKGLMPGSFLVILAMVVYTMALVLLWLRNNRLIAWCLYHIRQRIENIITWKSSRHGYRSLVNP